MTHEGRSQRLACPSDDEDTGLRCMREKGHPPPHRVELEWTDGPPPFFGCDCDAYEGVHDGTCAIYVQPSGDASSRSS